jgi:hypothetical protein
MTGKYTQAEKEDWIGFKNIICFYLTISQKNYIVFNLVMKLSKQHICFFCIQIGLSKLNSNLPREAFQYFLLLTWIYPELENEKCRIQVHWLQVN